MSHEALEYSEAKLVGSGVPKLLEPLSGVPLLATWGGVMWMYNFVDDLTKGTSDHAFARPVTMMASALMRYGIEHIVTVQDDLRGWLEQHEYTSVRQLKGCLSQQSVSFPSALERAHYVRAVSAT